MIKAVLFDVDGVLIDSFEANLRFFQRLMKAAGYDGPTREEYRHLTHMSLLEAVRALTQSASEEEIKRIWQMGRNREVQYDSDLLVMPEGADAVIAELHDQYVLGIVTSRVRERVFESPFLAKLEYYFETVVAYDDTDQHKPHPEPLLLAAERMAVKPEECVYVGDTLSDLQAGRSAGMRVITYSQYKQNEADVWTSSFTELLELISSFSAVQL